VPDIILIDDHPLLRKGLARTLEGKGDLRVVGQMDCAEDALDALDDLEPDLAVVDISLPGMSGIEFLKHLQPKAPGVRALVVSRHRELEVFELIGKGRSTREVAERLHLSVKTIESYRSRVKDKLHFDSSNELMKHAVQWVESEDSL